MASVLPIRGRGRGRDPIRTSLSESITTLSISNTSSATVSEPTSHTGRGRGRGRGFQRVTVKQDETPKSIVRYHKYNEQGTIGDKIRVLVNYFPIVQYPRQGLVYQYYIDVRNLHGFQIHREKRRILYRTWLEKLCRTYPNANPYSIVFDNASTIIVFDQRLLNINQNPTEETIPGMNSLKRMEGFKFMIKQVGDPIDFSLLNSSDAFINAHRDLTRVKQVLSIVLHEHCSSHIQFIYHRSFYGQPISENNSNCWDLGMGKALWRGFYTCLQFANGENKLLLNLDVHHSVFMKKQPFIDFLCEIILHSPCGKAKYGRSRSRHRVDPDDVVQFFDKDGNQIRYDAEVKFLLDQCRNLSVRWNYIGKPRISNIQNLGKAAFHNTFVWKKYGNRTVTTQQYYKEEYNLDLNYPSLPLLYMNNKQYIPMELVDVEPVRMKKITDEQRAMLCKYSSLNASERYQTIEQIRRNLKQQPFQAGSHMAAYNLQVDTNMLNVPARILPVPTIVYQHESKNIVRERQQTNHTLTKFYKPTDFPRIWAMINLSSSLNENMCQTFYDELSILAFTRGISMVEPDVYEELSVAKRSTDFVVNCVKQILNKNQDCTFIMVILPENIDRASEPYGSLKTLFELENSFGIVSQMIQPHTVWNCIEKHGSRYSQSILDIILRKMNSKLNGINSVLQVHSVIERFFTRGHRIMYVGADLSHGSLGSNDRRSVVAVVASADDVPNRYFKEIYLQERVSVVKGQGRECIIDMKDIMKSLIQQYYELRGYPPSSIVIYRDGISIYEFDTVFVYELEAIQKACVELSKVYQPRLTYILVNKEHRTRFFSEQPDRKVKPGTVVDSVDAIDPGIRNFYLNSHDKHMGTSRSTHYQVLYDDNELKTDEVQMLTYALCFTYARWNSPISVPAPVKYADLLATRAWFYADMYKKQNNESTSSTTATTINEGTEVQCNIISKRIELSSKLPLDCPFFL